MTRQYWVRYGSMGHVSRFQPDPDATHERGATVVVRSRRGVELGVVLIEAPAVDRQDDAPGDAFAILRTATADDLGLARDGERLREERYAVCRRVLDGGDWPIELIDVEPLLDAGRTVLLYLGPHRFDADGLVASLRAAVDLDFVLQPVGSELPEDAAQADDHGCGSCGTGGGCGSSGGCGTSGGCSDCGVKKLLAARP